jgi:hypothetical protein
MKKIRKVDIRRRKKEVKEAEEKLAHTTSLIQSHPKECCLCRSPFERTPQTVKTWQVMIKEDIVRLTCPDCWGTIREVVEKEQ